MVVDLLEFSHDGRRARMAAMSRGVQPRRCARSVWDRTLLCVPLVGDLAEAAPAEDVCLAKHVWSGVVDSLDMLVLSSHLLRERAILGVQNACSRQCVRPCRCGIWRSQSGSLELVWTPF